MADDLVAFLRARLDEDEQVARAATAGPWQVNEPTYATAIHGAKWVAVVDGSRWGGEASVFESTEDATHIARHDPARVVADVDAKRRMLMMNASAADNVGPERAALALLNLYALALPYADHPDYRPEWAPDA